MGSENELDLDEVDRKQAELLALVDEMTRTADSEQQQRQIQVIAQRSDELGRLCAQLEARARASARDLRGEIEVVLTAEQRQKVREDTGVDMASVILRDDGGGLVAAMSSLTREEVFGFALAEAQAQVREQKARAAAQAEFDRLAKELRRDAPSMVRQEIDRLLADPDFRRAFEPTKK